MSTCLYCLTVAAQVWEHHIDCPVRVVAWGLGIGYHREPAEVYQVYRQGYGARKGQNFRAILMPPTGWWSQGGMAERMFAIAHLAKEVGRINLKEKQAKRLGGSHVRV